MIVKSFYSIQFLRFVAAFLVVLHHANDFSAHYLPPSAIDALFVFGAFGVHLFFVISGFVMVCATKPDVGPAEFLRRRALRIFPIYWGYAAIALLVGTKLHLGAIIGALLLLPGYSSLIFGQGWSLSYELYFYLVFGLALLLDRTLGLIAITIFFCLSTALHPWAQNEFSKIATDSLLLEFLAGAWIAYLLMHHVVRLPRTLLVLATAFLAAGVVLGTGRLPTVLTWGLPAAMIVYGAACLEADLPKLVRRASHLGDSSYSLYLIHTLVLAALFTILHQGNRILLCVVFSIVATATAALAYIVLERPLQQAARTFLRSP